MLLKLILSYPRLFLSIDGRARFTSPSDTFLSEFGTPTLLWRVLQCVGYTEPPQYFWWEVDMTEELQWFAV